MERIHIFIEKFYNAMIANPLTSGSIMILLCLIFIFLAKIITKSKSDIVSCKGYLPVSGIITNVASGIEYIIQDGTIWPGKRYTISIKYCLGTDERTINYIMEDNIHEPRFKCGDTIGLMVSKNDPELFFITKTRKTRCS